MPELKIIIKAESTQARVDIIGSISEWNNNNATDMRQRCQELKDSGCNSCHVYVMSEGGDCFQANEIVNILNEVFGSYTGSGGALVASAGTYIAVCATSFENASNGQWMIHKPSGGTYGNETEIENQLTLLKNMTKTYYDMYMSKCKKPEADFKAKWDAGDFWMTAQEAKEWGFITSIKEPVKVTQAMAASIKASGSPIDFSPEDIIISTQNKDNEMNLQAIALTIGLAANASEADITARIAENAQKAKDYDALRAQIETKEKNELAAKIKARLDKAEQEKVITADSRKGWESVLNADYDANVKLLDSMKPVVALSDEIIPSAEGGAGTYNGKTFEELQETPAILEALQKEKPTVYDALFADWKTRNGLK